MSYEAAKVWIDAMQFVWMIAATVWVFWGNKTTELSTRLESAHHVNDEQDVRLATLEEQITHIPSHGEMTDLIGDVRAVKTAVEALNETTRGNQRQLELINQYLLNNRP